MKMGRKQQINRLQENLSSIRKIAGWTTEQFGEKIGVTKQTISNLENKKTPMTLTQYIAIRAVLDYEIQQDPANTVLPQVISILVDREDDFSEKEYSQVKEAISEVSASASAGIKGATLATIAGALLGTTIALGSISTLGPIGLTTGGIACWLKKIMDATDA